MADIRFGDNADITTLSSGDIIPVTKMSDWIDYKTTLAEIKVFCATNAIVYKTTIDCSWNPNYPAATIWDLYIASVDWKIWWVSWNSVNAWDWILCNTTTIAGDQATVWSKWNIVEHNIDWAVVWPASSTDNAIARFDSTTWKLLQNWTATEDDDWNVISTNFVPLSTITNFVVPLDTITLTIADKYIQKAIWVWPSAFYTLPVVSTLTIWHSFKFINKLSNSLVLYIQPSWFWEQINLNDWETAIFTCIAITWTSLASWNVQRGVAWTNTWDQTITLSWWVTWTWTWAITTTLWTWVVWLTNLDTTLDHTAYNWWIWASHSPMSAVVTSAAWTVTLTFQKEGWGDMDLIFSTWQVTVDCTPALTIALTAWSDVSPTENWVYITKAAPTVLTKSTVWFPTWEEFFPVWRYLVESAATVATYWLYKAHQWTDHIWKDTTSNWHISHIDDWIRQQPATWSSWALCTPTLTTAASPDTLTIWVSSWVVYQLHTHNTPAFDSATAWTTALTTFFIPNHTTAYTPWKDLYNFKLTSWWVAATSNDRISWVVWGCVDETDVNYKIFVNLPSWFYWTDAAAIADSSKYTNYNIPAAYAGCWFLIAKLTYKYSNAWWWGLTLVENVDLRGQFPSRFAGWTAATATVFLDNAFAIDNVTDITKTINFSAAWNSTWIITTIASQSTWTATITLPVATSTLYWTATWSITSAQMLASLSDETWTWALVFANTPTLETPVLWAATWTSIVLSSKIDEAKWADIASATTTDIWAATWNYINITWTTTITGLWTVQAWTRRIVNFSWALILTHHATALILPSAANITTVAWDTAIFISLGSWNWKCTNYTRYDWTALVSASSSSSNQWYNLTWTYASTSTFTFTWWTNITAAQTEWSVFHCLQVATACTASSSTWLLITLNWHWYWTNDIVIFWWTATPTWLTAWVKYFVIYVDANTFKVSLTFWGSAIAYSDDWTSVTVQTLKFWYVKSATNAAWTVTVTVIVNKNLASWDDAFMIAPNRKLIDYTNYITIPWEQVTDATNPQGMFYIPKFNSYVLPIDSSVSAIPVWGSIACAWNIYNSWTAIYTSAADLAWNLTLVEQRPTVSYAITAANRVTMRVTSSVWTTSKATDLQLAIPIVPISLFLST